MHLPLRFRISTIHFIKNWLAYTESFSKHKRSATPEVPEAEKPLAEKGGDERPTTALSAQPLDGCERPATAPKHLAAPEAKAL